MDKVIKIFQPTGPCEIDIEELKSVWDKSWRISKWQDEYTLLHYNRNSENFTRIDFKVTISKEQANEIIQILELVEVKSDAFTSGSTFLRKHDSLNI